MGTQALGNRELPSAVDPLKPVVAYPAFLLYEIMMVEFEPIKFSRDIQPAMLPGLDCTTRKIQHDQKKTKLLFAGWGDTLPNKWPMARHDRPHWNLPNNEHLRLNSTPKYSSNWLQIMQAELLTIDQP